MNTANYAFIGDIHSQIAPLLKAVDYCEQNDCIPVLLGDLFDSRMELSDSVAVYELVQELHRNGAIVLRSNHQDKLERYARGNNVRISEGFDRTIEDFENAAVSIQEVAEWLKTFPYGIALRDSQGVEYRCAHAMFPSWVLVPENYTGVYHVNEVTRKAKDYMIYGPRRAGAVWPDEETRVYWWKEESERDWVRVAGHYHTVFIGDKSLVLDGEMGGSTREDFDPSTAKLCLWNLEEKQLVEFV